MNNKFMAFAVWKIMFKQQLAAYAIIVVLNHMNIIADNLWRKQMATTMTGQHQPHDIPHSTFGGMIKMN